jgi:two-component system osmolarity sensor histidine kinase EnvZ
MDELINAQLTFARAQHIEDSQAVDINGLLTDLIEAAKAQTHTRISFRTGTRRRVIAVAAVALKRSVSNLLNNALRYAGEKPVQVVLRSLNGALFIGIRDQGSGIPPEQITAVFRPFYRLETSRNRGTGGSGLGLAITKQLADTHQWQLALKRRLGGGVSAWLKIET